MMEQNKPTKTCEYCGSVGPAFTFMNGETICKSCFSRYPVDGRKCRHRIRELEAELEDAIQGSLRVKQMKRIAELESELAALRQQQTFAWNALDSAMIKDHDRTGNLAESITRLAMERDELRQQQGEPIGYFQDVNEFVPGAYPRIEKVIDAAKDSPGVFPLYREAAPRVPDGWKLVPVEPTKEMVEAIVKETGCSYGAAYRAFKAYLAALAAAPNACQCTGPDGQPLNQCDECPR